MPRRKDPASEPALDRQPVLPARSHAAAPSGSRLPDGTGRGWVAATTSARAAVVLIRVDQHPLGPRVYILGQRVHEVALGIAVLVGVAVGLLLHLLQPTLGVAGVAAVGGWLVAKDWRDLFPRWRTQQPHRRFGFHLAAGSRLRLRLDLPVIAATATLAVAAVNAASALTPNVAWRGHALLQIEPVSALPIFHAIALPASIVLALTAVHLGRRRRRALLLAIGLLLVLGVADELKGLDFEEAARSAPLAGARWHGAGAQRVRRPARATQHPGAGPPADRDRHGDDRCRNDLGVARGSDGSERAHRRAGSGGAPCLATRPGTARRSRCRRRRPAAPGWG